MVKMNIFNAARNEVPTISIKKPRSGCLREEHQSCILFHQLDLYS